MLRHVLIFSTILLLFTTSVLAEQSPDRTTLPIPLSKFEGKIGKTYKESEADWQEPPAAPEGAPNVIVILLDDVGFGQTSTFGGLIPTPNFDELAAEGLKYNRFHTTAICGPTRAALLDRAKSPRVRQWLPDGMGDRISQLLHDDSQRARPRSARS